MYGYRAYSVAPRLREYAERAFADLLAPIGITSSPTTVTVTPTTGLREPVAANTVLATITIAEGSHRRFVAPPLIGTSSAPVRQTLAQLP